MSTTGYGFTSDLVNHPHGIDTEWVTRIEAFHYSWGWGITGINLAVPWDQFEPTPGNYQLAALQKVIDFCDARGLTLSIMFLARRLESDGFVQPSEMVKGHRGKVFRTGPFDVFPSYGCDRTNALIFNAVKKIAEKLNTYSRAGFMTMGGGHTAELVNHIIDDNAAGYPQLGDFSDDNLARFNQWCSSRGLATPGIPPIVDGSAWPHPNFSDARGLEFARFLSYNIGKYQRNFVSAVKSVSSIPVIYTYAAASNSQLLATSNANMNYIAATSDGMYGSEGDGVSDHVAKFRVNSVNLGNFPNGISCVEFDPDDWTYYHEEHGTTPPLCYNQFQQATVKNSMQSLYNKGVRYILLTMAYCPAEIQGMSSTLQDLRQSHVGKPYVRPAINASNTVTVEVTQKYRAGQDLVAGINVYNQYAKYTDNDFWGGVAPGNGTGCTPPAAPTLSANPMTINAGGSSTLTASNYVNGGTISWAGGLGSTPSISVTPSATTTYYATVSKDGCTSSQASVTVTVNTPPVNGNLVCSSSTVIGYGNSSENGTYTVNNTGAAGTYTVKLSYSRYESTSAASGSIKVNNGASQALSLPYTGSNPDSYQELTFSANLISGTNSFQIFGGSNGFFRTQKVCFQSQQSCTPPAAPTLSANPMTINAGGSSTLTASNYVSGGAISWAGGLGSNPSISVTPSTTTTYYATVSKDGCTSSQASVTVTVNTPPVNGNLVCSSSTVIGYGNSSENGTYTVNNTGVAGAYTIKLSYSRYESTSAASGSIKVNNGASQVLSLPYTGSNPDSYQELTFSANLISGTNSFQIFGGSNGFFRTQKVCFQTQQSCTTPAAPTLTANPATITAGGTSTLTASNYVNGGVISWAGGLGSNPSITVTPSATTTYYATVSKDGCTSSQASVTVTVGTTSAINCNTLQSDFGSADCFNLNGWIYDQSHPNTVVNIDVYEGSTLIAGNLPAGNFRQDLLDAGKGNGYHGFLIQTPGQLKNGQNRAVTIKATGCNYVLANSPRTINCAPGARVNASLENPSGNEEPALEISVAPNPNSGVFDASFYQGSAKSTLSVINTGGSVVFKKDVAGRGQHKVKVSLNCASGTYYIVLDQGNGKKTKRVVVIK